MSPNLVEADNKLNMSPFSMLPREVRDPILFYLCGDQHVVYYNGLCKYEDQTGRHRRLMGIKYLIANFTVSRRFYDEAMTILYTTSTFEFGTHVSSFDRLLHTLPVQYSNRIRKLKIWMKAGDVEVWCEALKENASSHLAGLWNIEIMVTVPVIPWMDWIPAKVLTVYSSFSLPML